MNIVVFNHPEQNITGGHKYNQELYDYLSEISGITIQYHPLLSKAYKGWTRLFAPFLELCMLKFIHRGDIVFFCDTTYKYHALLLPICRFLVGSTNIIIIHHFTYLGLKGLKRKLFEFVQNMYYKNANIIIVPSPFTKDIAEEKLKGMTIEYVPLPFDNHYKPSSRYNEGEMLFVGAIEPRKGLHLLLEALNILKRNGNSFKLNIIGKVVNEQYNQELRNYVSRHNLQSEVFFRGRVSVEELNDYYSTAEMFVFPSVLEGYGIVLVEALSHGLPIIAFDNTAMPYTVKHGVNGYLAKNLDSDDLARQIIKVLSNKSEREKLQKGIQQTLSSVKTLKDFKNAISLLYNTIRK